MSRFGDLLAGKTTPAPTPAPAPAPEPVVEPVVESVVEPVVEEVVEEESEEEVEEESEGESDLSLYDMSKRELEEYARTVGLELDRRHSKSALIQELTDYLAN